MVFSQSYVLFIYIKFTMEIGRIKGLKPNESAVFVYIIIKNLCNAKQISRSLEIDIYNLYKIINELERRKLIIKVKGKKYYEYKAVEEINLK